MLQDNGVMAKRIFFIAFNLAIVLSWAVQLAEKDQERVREETIAKILWWDDEINRLEVMLSEIEVSLPQLQVFPGFVVTEGNRLHRIHLAVLLSINTFLSTYKQLTVDLGEGAPRADPMGISTKHQNSKGKQHRQLRGRKQQKLGQHAQKEEPFTNSELNISFFQEVCDFQEAGPKQDC